ncbi:hypothetical protein [Methanosarcina acetivorans]|uniref:Uncharacterized protein n=1 Tax=Methanosarcina acetivorans (strain ATCC 35395 / DSM 2834 / JCM 12185 / C2A) TaxID=188937 RepID=Q8TLK8_METAC|nr:hypothetical protein [Methanosarcina acetivorans]AAM06401.1 predicted protein [Methanosarcina acetivorans C2A]
MRGKTKRNICLLTFGFSLELTNGQKLSGSFFSFVFFRLFDKARSPMFLYFTVVFNLVRLSEAKLGKHIKIKLKSKNKNKKLAGISFIRRQD